MCISRLDKNDVTYTSYISTKSYRFFIVMKDLDVGPCILPSTVIDVVNNGRDIKEEEDIVKDKA